MKSAVHAVTLDARVPLGESLDIGRKVQLDAVQGVVQRAVHVAFDMLSVGRFISEADTDALTYAHVILGNCCFRIIRNRFRSRTLAAV